MPHQCTRCGKLFPDAAEELLKGCSCGSKFFYYIKQERVDEIKEERSREVKELIKELEKSDKEQIEKDIREITGMDKKPERPVILDLESVKVIRPGKFEIDVVNLFNKRRPLIYKLEEGKYIIDLAASLKVDEKEIAKKIRDPDLVIEDFEEDEEIIEEKESKDKKRIAEEQKEEESEKEEGVGEKKEESKEEIAESSEEEKLEEKKKEDEKSEEESENKG